MPTIKRKKREPKETKAEDVIVKVSNFRFYFQNYYTLITLINDFLLGILFFIGSLATILEGPEWIRQYSYLVGAFFMIMRPIFKIMRNVFIYDKEEFQEQVLQADIFDGYRKQDSGNNQSKEKTNQK